MKSKVALDCGIENLKPEKWKYWHWKKQHYKIKIRMNGL